ncbi:hypothetical protein ACFQER_07320 [Halomicroarcula sp. GCM10025894]|uniref:hypothetical protein n=1 Tax=Halomicroarcula sp. GCM10025894 TaxID=3252673 RepID=UPI00361DDCBF
MSAPDIAVYDHLRSTDPDDDDAVYRVVGTRPESVTLLRVSDGDGRRANTGKSSLSPARRSTASNRRQTPTAVPSPRYVRWSAGATGRSGRAVRC